MLPLEGDLDVVTVPGVRALLRARVEAGCRRVILNLQNTTYIDSLGMCLILATARRLRERGGLLSLINVSEQVYRTLVICRLVDFIPVTGAAPKPPIPALDPSVRPLWRSTMRVDAGRLSETRARVEQLLSTSTELVPDEVFDMTLACGEALGNAVDHAGAEGVLATLAVYPDRVVAEVSDCGCGYELGPDEAPCACEDEGAERGRGIKLMRLLTDSVEIQHKASGQGTVVRLVKLFTTTTARDLAQHLENEAVEDCFSLG